MSLSYIVSAKKSTVISKTEVGNFTDPKNLNLILNRGNRLDVQLLTPEGLKSVCEIPVYGRITNLQLFRPKNAETDYLIVLTEKLQMAVLAYENSKIVTKAAGNIADRVGRLTDYGTIITVHKSGLIAVRLYDGTLKLVEWEKHSDLKHFNVRFDSINVIDVKFMETKDEIYRMAYISEDNQGRHLRVVDLGMNDKEFRAFSSQENISNDASFIIPVPQPIGGVIVLGMDTILYHPDDRRNPVSCPVSNNTSFTAYSKVDVEGNRYLLSDNKGRLLMLLLNVDDSIREMRVEHLGLTSTADTVKYLDNAVAFIGSRLGDSQLIRLLDSPNPDGSFVEILETYVNIGPIRDMIHVETEGQTQLITVSGAHKDGSLRVVRNGVGIDESNNADCPGVENIFVLRYKSELDNYVIASTDFQTHCIKVVEDDLTAGGLLDFNENLPTIFAGCLFKNAELVVQVTKNGVQLMKEGKTSVFWRPESQELITKAAANVLHGQIVIAAKDELYYLRCLEDGDSLEIQEISKRVMSDEISCVDISNEKDDGSKEANFVVVTLWNSFKLESLTITDLVTRMEAFLPTKVVARSVIATYIDGINYLLVALGDGVLLYYTHDLQNAQLGEVKRTSVGTRPPSMRRIWTNRRQHVFVCSDRPVIVFSHNRKLVFSNVNLKLVNAICSINSSHFRDSLVLADKTSIIFGTIDDIQKIHVRTYPMGESVRRIAHQKSTGTYAVLSTREDVGGVVSTSASTTAVCKSGYEKKAQDESSAPAVSEISSLMILDQHTFKVQHTYFFEEREVSISVISGQLGQDPKFYYIVGTSIINPEETESKQGKLIVFQVDPEDRSKLRFISQKEIRGTPYSINILNGKLLVAINSAVRMFEWDPDTGLRHECASFNNITALSVKVMGDQILVADLMRSMKLLTYRSMEGTLDEVAKESNCMWMAASDFITAEKVIGAELQHNLFVCEVDKTRAAADDSRYPLEAIGFFYLGEMVNVMRRCSLVTPPDDSLIQVSQPIMFGTVDGSIGLVVQIDEKWKKLLLNVEKAIADSIKNCLQIDHSTYRQFSMKKRVEPATGFVDGDLIESILDIERSAALQILSRVPASGDGIPTDPAEILKIIEDLSRIH